MRFEYRLRVSVNEAMTFTVGPDWTRHRVPELLRTAGTDQRNRVLAAGGDEQSTFAIANFTDCVAITIRKDNWRNVYGGIFQRKPSAEESF